MLKPTTILVSLSVFAVELTGCGRGRLDLLRQACIREVALAYLYFEAANVRAPSDIEELRPYLQTQTEFYDNVDSGAFVVTWDADVTNLFKDQTRGQYAIGYESKATTKIGYVAMRQ